MITNNVRSNHISLFKRKKNQTLSKIRIKYNKAKLIEKEKKGKGKRKMISPLYFSTHTWLCSFKTNKLCVLFHWFGHQFKQLINNNQHIYN